MSGNGDMNAWIRQAMTPKHALESFVGLLGGQPAADDGHDGQRGSQDAGGTGNGSRGGQEAPRRRVNTDAGEGNRPENRPDAGGNSHQAMNRLLKDAVRGKDRD